ncbi:hypothetical protein [Flavobacterium sp.]|uniref:hypothetical protein n=1 Tax=Flavobacterium sp. TaxID=239 RepID=UPI00286DDAA4|nr:hypothetical protein [Flavobacterium sp.]
MIKNKLLSVFVFASFAVTVSAQSPVSGFMQGKGKGNVVVSYGMEKYDKVLLVPKVVDAVPVFRNVDVSSASLYATYGITDQLDIEVSLPFITVTGNASEEVLKNLNFENERSGLQDVSAFLKFNPFDINIGSSNLKLIGALGVKTPVGDYKVDEGLQSIIAIGNRSTTVSAITLAMFKTKYGIFTTGQFGVNLASKGVPDSYISEIKLGYAASKIYGDVFISNQTSAFGTDILANGFDGFFPGTRVNTTRVGLNLYAPIYKTIGIAGGANSYIDGRNLGKATGFYGALVYKF